MSEFSSRPVRMKASICSPHSTAIRQNHQLQPAWSP